MTEVLSDDSKFQAYESMLKTYAGYAQEIYAFGVEVTKATAIATAYTNYSVINNEKTIADLEDAIKTYNTAISDANKEINETINNGITDKATMIAYLEKVIAELNTQIAANNAVAEKYRALILGSTGNTQNTTPAETPAAE